MVTDVNLWLASGLTIVAVTLLGMLLVRERRRQMREPLSTYRQALRSLRRFRVYMTDVDETGRGTATDPRRGAAR